MDEKEKDLEIPDDIVDDDKIDLKEEEEPTSDDLFDSEESDSETEDEEGESANTDDETTEDVESKKTGTKIVVTQHDSKDSEAEEISEDEESDESENDQIESDEIDSSEESTEDKTVGDAIDEAEDQKSDVFQPDAEVDAAVDDIVRTESDETIAQVDAKLGALNESKKKRTFKDRFKGFFVAWWENKPIRYGTFAGIFILLTAIILLPTSRYTVLNLAGVRVTSSMVVVDSETKLPLKNIHVQLQDKNADTDDDGRATFAGLKLGKSKLIISKNGYADTDKEIVLGWGSNPIGEQEILATGEQFTFVLSDWKSAEKITKAEATSGENSAKADDNGKIILTVGQENVDNVEVKITAENYREEILSGDELAAETIELKLVPSKKHVFISNRDNKYDLYKIDVDAQNEEILLEATGKEREVPTVTPHSTKNTVAFVSSRDGDKNTDGFVLDGIFIINSETGSVDKIARSEQLQLIGWDNDNLVYLQIVEGTSAGSPQRSKIISYNLETDKHTELATANYFNDVELVGDTLYYSVSSYAIPESQAKLFTVKVDGRESKKLVDMQVWNIFRTDYDSLLFSAENQKWYVAKVGQDATETTQVASSEARHFVNNPKGDKTAWVDVRDGKGVLLSSDTKEFAEKQVLVLPGLNDVLYWVNDSTLVFRVISNSETADYILNLNGGEASKITDITASRNTYF